MTNARAYSRALDRAEDWMYKAVMYYNVGNRDMYDFCSRVSEHFRSMATRFI